MKTSRRNFLKLATGAVAVSTISSTDINTAEASPNKDFAPNTMAKLYDSTMCIGCQTCVVHCYTTNFLERSKYVDQIIPHSEQSIIMKEDLVPKLAPEDEFNPDKPWVNISTLDYRLRTVIQKYVDENDTPHFIKRNCMHCLHPGCVSACPVKALTKNEEDGVVLYDADKCIGCRYCQMACPFNVPKFEWKRAIPKISKCDMCRSTLGAVGIKGTACTNVCPTGAVVYGKRSDLLAEAKRRIADNPGKYFNDKILGEKIYGKTSEIFLAAVDFKYLGIPTDKIADYSYAANSEGLQHTIYKWGIAPIALYTALAVVAYRNNKKHHEDNSEGDK